MSTWQSLQGAVLQTRGVVMGWWAARTHDERLRERSSRLCLEGALLRRGPASVEVDRRLRTILMRVQTVKTMRAGHSSRSRGELRG